MGIRMKKVAIITGATGGIGRECGFKSFKGCGEKKRYVGVFIVCEVSACYCKIIAAEVCHADLGAEYRAVFAGVE